MKNINYVINGILAVAVVILFIMQLSSGKKAPSAPSSSVATGEVITGKLPIAYVNMDSLLLGYNYYSDMSEVLMKKEENYRANIGQKTNSLRNEMADFQRKIENNAFLTRERAEQEQQRLLNKQQELQELDNRLMQELYNEQQKMIEQLRDSLVSELHVYNQDKGYQLIFSNASGSNTILIADDIYDITAEVVEHLNRNYSAPQ